MSKIFDLNVTKTEKGKFSSNLGTAHELLVTGVLMRLGFDVSVSSVKGGPYDLLITAYTNGPKSKSKTIRAQVRTCSKNGTLKFIAGSRAGVDRSYKSERKELVDKRYKYSEKHNDLLIGIDRHSCDLYLIPTQYLKFFGKSKNIKKLKELKNNWNILLNWRNKYLENLFKKLAK